METKWKNRHGAVAAQAAQAAQSSQQAKQGRKAARQQDSKTARQQNSKAARQQDSKTARQQDSKTARQQDSALTAPAQHKRPEQPVLRVQRAVDRETEPRKGQHGQVTTAALFTEKSAHLLTA